MQSVSIKSFTKPAGKRESKGEGGGADDSPSGADNGIDASWANSFTPEQLQKVWNDYARLVEKSNPRLFSMLTARSPRLKGTDVVVFPLQNETQEVELMKEKTPLFDHLRRELKHAKLQLEIEYTREEEGPQKAYTAADKYRILADKNPLLDKLKDMLSLDIE